MMSSFGTLKRIKVHFVKKIKMKLYPERTFFNSEAAHEQTVFPTRNEIIID